MKIVEALSSTRTWTNLDIPDGLPTGTSQGVLTHPTSHVSEGCGSTVVIYQSQPTEPMFSASAASWHVMKPCWQGARHSTAFHCSWVSNEWLASGLLRYPVVWYHLSSICWHTRPVWQAMMRAGRLWATLCGTQLVSCDDVPCRGLGLRVRSATRCQGLCHTPGKRSNKQGEVSGEFSFFGVLMYLSESV